MALIYFEGIRLMANTRQFLEKFLTIRHNTRHVFSSFRSVCMLICLNAENIRMMWVQCHSSMDIRRI